MGLTSLELRDFRLFEHYHLEPDPAAVTVLMSANGTGKTTVLEAVYALATASSFRTSTTADLIRNQQSLAEVHGVISVNERRVQVDLTLSRGPRRVIKKMLVNGQAPRSRADLAEALPVTIFTPEGVDMIRQGPEGRRTFLTTLLTDVDLKSGELVERFERTLRQRNALLRANQNRHWTMSARDELDAWTSDFVAVSTDVLSARRRLIEKLSEPVERCYRTLAGDTPRVIVHYETSWSGDLAAAVSEALDTDRFRGYSTVGPHRDDVILSLDGRDARRQASQGEQRCLALALRLAGHQLVTSERSVVPLLLLDDVFSELDPLRSERLLGLLPHGQTLVTTASPVPTSLHPAVVIQLPVRHS